MAILNLTELNDTLTGPDSAPLPGGLAPTRLRCRVYLKGTEQLARLFSDSALTDLRANPLNADDSGQFSSCHVLNGEYDLVITTEDENTIISRSKVSAVSEVSMGIAGSFRTVSAMVEDVFFTYDNGEDQHTVVVGDIFQISGSNFNYRILPQDSVDFHLQTASDLKLEVIPGDGAILNAAAFHVDVTGSTDTTDQLKRFYEACIAGQVDGYIPPGTYKVRPGVLVFDSGNIERPLPYFRTSGASSTIFEIIENNDAPVLTITNGTTTTGAGRFWMGGGHEGVTFYRPAAVGNDVVANQHGLVLRGVQGANFAAFHGENLGGDLIHLERKLFGGTNPDPHHVALCQFAYLEAKYCKGYVFRNDNYVGFNGSHIARIRAIACGGIFWGIGAGNSIGSISAGSCSGWAVGDSQDGIGGTSSNFKLDRAELDDVEYGFQIGRLTRANFGTVRFIHRYEFSPRNAGTGLYWPRLALDVGGVSTFDVKAEVTHRIESGGTKADLGVFCEFNNAGGNITDVIINTDIQDNAALGVERSDIAQNVNMNSTARLEVRNEAPVMNTIGRVGCLVRIDPSYQLPHGGFSPTQRIQWNTISSDPADRFDTLNGQYTCPFTGVYRVKASLSLAASFIGERLRLGIALDNNIYGGQYYYAMTTNPTVYSIEMAILASAGQKLSVVGDQNSGAAKSLSPVISLNENQFLIEPVL
jgi:hypothetical protein